MPYVYPLQSENTGYSKVIIVNKEVGRRTKLSGKMSYRRNIIPDTLESLFFEF